MGEDEPEDIAVRKFMKKVVESRLIEQVRLGGNGRGAAGMQQLMQRRRLSY